MAVEATKRQLSNDNSSELAEKKQKCDEKVANADVSEISNKGDSSVDSVFEKLQSADDCVRERAVVLLANSLGGLNRFSKKLIKDEARFTKIAGVLAKDDNLAIRHAALCAMDSLFTSSWAKPEFLACLATHLYSILIESSIIMLIEDLMEGSKRVGTNAEQMELVVLAALQLLRSMTPHVAELSTKDDYITASKVAKEVIWSHFKPKGKHHFSRKTVMEAIATFVPFLQDEFDYGILAKSVVDLQQTWAERISIQFALAAFNKTQVSASNEFWTVFDCVLMHRPISRCLKLDEKKNDEKKDDAEVGSDQKDDAKNDKKTKSKKEKRNDKVKKSVFPEDWSVESAVANRVFEHLVELSTTDSGIVRKLVGKESQLLKVFLDMKHLPRNFKELSHEDVLLLSRLTLAVSRLFDIVSQSGKNDEEKVVATLPHQESWSDLCGSVLARLMDFLQQCDRSGQNNACLLIAECIESCMDMLMAGLECGYKPQKSDLSTLKRLVKGQVEKKSLLEDLDASRGHAAVLLGVGLPLLESPEKHNYLDPLLGLVECESCSSSSACAALDAIFEAYAEDADRPSLAKCRAAERLDKVRSKRDLYTDNEQSGEDDDSGTRENLTAFLVYLRSHKIDEAAVAKELNAVDEKKKVVLEDI